MDDKRLGLIVNPIAGMGGSVGLKGTDGKLADVARDMGASPIAESRAAIALGELTDMCDSLTVITVSGKMGEAAALDAGLLPQIVAATTAAATTAQDTARGVTAILQRNPDLLLFVGGDGTARDVLSVTGTGVPILGVPSGVKMHSGVFAATARAAGTVAKQFLTHRDSQSLLRDADIVDRDADTSEVRLYGSAKTPHLSLLVPGAKAADPGAGEAQLRGAVRRVADLLRDDRVSLIGPGATMRAVKQELGFDGTLLGVDAVARGRCVACDMNEESILDLVSQKDARIVVSVVGGQGFLFGRGNQQLGPRVIRAVGPDNIVIVSSFEKLAAIPGQRLRVDTGDEALDRQLAGHREVIVGGMRTVVMPVGAPD